MVTLALYQVVLISLVLICIIVSYIFFYFSAKNRINKLKEVIDDTIATLETAKEALEKDLQEHDLLRLEIKFLEIHSNLEVKFK